MQGNTIKERSFWWSRLVCLCCRYWIYSLFLTLSVRPSLSLSHFSMSGCTLMNVWKALVEPHSLFPSLLLNETKKRQYSVKPFLFCRHDHVSDKEILCWRNVEVTWEICIYINLKIKKRKHFLVNWTLL